MRALQKRQQERQEKLEDAAAEKNDTGEGNEKETNEEKEGKAGAKAEEVQLTDETFTVWHLNARGWKSKATEVTALLRLQQEKPEVVCVTKSFLNKDAQKVF